MKHLVLGKEEGTMNRLISPAVMTALLLIALPSSAVEGHGADQKAGLATNAVAAAPKTGDRAPTEDKRTALVWTQAERSFILVQMRKFLRGVQIITEALSRGDMKTVAQTARPMGAGHDMPVSLKVKGKLPPAFKQMSSGVHTAFDQIALDAEQLGDVSHTLTQLSGALQQCVACHETYRIAAAEQLFPPLASELPAAARLRREGVLHTRRNSHASTMIDPTPAEKRIILSSTHSSSKDVAEMY